MKEGCDKNPQPTTVNRVHNFIHKKFHQNALFPCFYQHAASFPLPLSLRRQLQSNSSGATQDPLRFHSAAHGENVRVLRDGSVARRVESFCKGIAFSNRPVRINEYILLKLIEVSSTWSGVVRFGFTNQDPGAQRTNWPKYACPDLTNKPGYWAKALPDRLIKTNVILFYYVTHDGYVHFGVNDEEKGVFFAGVDVRKPLWALIDIYGNTVAVEMIDPRRQMALSSDRRVEALTPQDLSLLPTFFTNLQLKPLAFHLVHGKNIRLSNDRLTASREQSEYSQGYVFTERPMTTGQQLIIKVLENVKDYFGALTFGFTSCDPETIDPDELPEDGDHLLDRQEYWVVIKNVAVVPQPGDELSFLMTDEGEVLFSKNNEPYVSLLFVDYTQRLWAFFDVYGITLKIKSLGWCSQSKNLNHKSESLEVMNDNQENTESECMMCCERPVNSVLYTCGHMCMCYDCAEQHMKKPSGNWCPICRAKVQDVIRTYRS